jgi:Tfp pilus assembly protein PilF
MPDLPSKDVAHTQTADHRILRYPTQAPVPQLQVRGKPLVSFPENDAPLASARDFALAWEMLAQRNLEGAAKQAELYEEEAVKKWPDDAPLLSAMGFVEQKQGKREEAREFYERALKMKPRSNTAATNLGILEAESGDVKDAVKLWQQAFARVPYRSAIGMDLAIVFCTAGQKEDAKHYLEQVLEFNPDYGKGRALLEHLNESSNRCSP